MLSFERIKQSRYRLRKSLTHLTNKASPAHQKIHFQYSAGELWLSNAKIT
jgi:hypothetical protein